LHQPVGAMPGGLRKLACTSTRVAGKIGMGLTERVKV
jgi:hypothetical protein